MKEQSKQTKLTLENFLRMSFHPKGIRRFAEGVYYELEWTSKESYIPLKLATALDISKYVMFATVIGKGLYELIK